ncbi:homoserine dehydrogenase [Clostridium fermenticellae]|uniref:Homoserine dehydrogenase n=1 Tax=Clostridium fermenticellae TaxID=2068654 RepID=A0A386H320_9CLOT|nr:homoserine dehydrogenase [Clostridium fermenticellae]AYD39875.1 homoserine dehydrogenase [Clostridium fermenticellae]
MACIAMLGYGVVGSGVAELILKNRGKFKKNLNQELILSKILVKNTKKHKDNKNSDIMTDDINEIFKAKVDIVVEAMGGLEPSYEYVKKALNLKKHVVTANKDLIAEYGCELLKIAGENGVTLQFEASVGGGIPILKSISECLVGNEINGIKAILNGTTNFILSKMSADGMRYDEALKLAQESGFAESNPESDVMGYDAARKLSILSTIAYDRRVEWKDINITGITDIDEKDFMYAKQEGYNIKLVGMSRREEGKIYASIMPVMVREESVLGKIENEYNVIVVDGDAVGDVVFSGKGAGMFPTASAVFGDIIDIIGHKRTSPLSFNDEIAEIDKYWSSEDRWLIRINTSNRLEVIKNISANFKMCHIFSNSVTGDNGNEVAAFVKASDEKSLNNIIDGFLKLDGVEKVKKILVMDR